MPARALFYRPRRARWFYAQRRSPHLYLVAPRGKTMNLRFRCPELVRAAPGKLPASPDVHQTTVNSGTDASTLSSINFLVPQGVLVALLISNSRTPAEPPAACGDAARRASQRLLQLTAPGARGCRWSYPGPLRSSTSSLSAALTCAGHASRSRWRAASWTCKTWWAGLTRASASQALDPATGGGGSAR